MLKRGFVISLIFAVQLVGALFFVLNILFSVIGFAPLNWQVSEFIELGAAVSLLIGVGLTWWVLVSILKRNKLMEVQLRAASGAFMDLLYERFQEWELTPAEADVALFAIKGLSTQDIAGLRGVSEGTVKAQTNAIYRKAGVTGRPQLLSQFLDDLISTPIT
tara:strand:+ start:47947 stop:48432 length:486 start_codon:yes stop_codon:yes gene_type:complete